VPGGRKSFLMKFCIFILILLVFTSVSLDEGGEQSLFLEIEGQNSQPVIRCAGGDKAEEAPSSSQQMEPENLVNAGIKLNFIDWLTILAIALILIWIAVQVLLMKRKKKGF